MTSVGAVPSLVEPKKSLPQSCWYYYWMDFIFRGASLVDSKGFEKEEPWAL